MTRAYEAMMFAREVHKTQTRKYTGNPYTDHLAEVAGIAMSTGWTIPSVHPDKLMAVCWLHDCMEDQGVDLATLQSRFGFDVANGVWWLTDTAQGNRAQREGTSRLLLNQAPDWVQTIKCADLISNTASIVQHDPEFAVVYLEEKQLLLKVLTRADHRLRGVAEEQVREALVTLRDPQKNRFDAQAKGEHPAPCARFCEANAFQIELRSLRAENAQLHKAAWKQSEIATRR